MDGGEETSRSRCRRGWNFQSDENYFNPSSEYRLSDDHCNQQKAEIREPQLFILDDEFESLAGAIEYQNPDAENTRTGISDMEENDDVGFLIGNSSEVDGYTKDMDDDDHINVGLHSRPCSDDDEDETKEVYPMYHRPVGTNLPVFEVSMKFTRDEFREAVDATRILSGRPIIMTHNDTKRMREKCFGAKCPWSLHAKRLNNLQNPDYVLTTMNLQHGLMCEETFEKTKISAKWLADKFMDKFISNTTMPLKQIRHEVDASFKCEITVGKAYAARKIAVEKIHGNAILQYKQLWNYVEELKRTHPGSTFDIMFEPFRENGKNNRFMRFYSCFGALKDGFIQCCRPIIFMDGFFLTGLYKGQLLTAIGVDGNNGYWPIAWVVVEKEFRETWLWFINLLVADLEISNQSSYFTIMSDQQKGLGIAIAEILPRAERRFCVQHLYSNFKKKHAGKELKDHLWRIANSTTEEIFQANMEVLKVFDIDAYNWVLKSAPRKTWVKAFFPTHVKCDTLVNNMCEFFNSKILKAREKSIINLKENIRKYCMERIKTRGELNEKNRVVVCNSIRNILHERSENARGWNVISNGAGGYEVQHPRKGQFVVVLSNKTCTCRLWQLSGIPCCHAIPCIRRNSQNPLAYVDNCYSKVTFQKLYHFFLMPINGHQMWPKSLMFKLEPPRYVPQMGRPKKTRFEGVEIVSADNGAQRMRRRNVIHCGICGGTGHNRLTCKAPVDENGICITPHGINQSALWTSNPDNEELVEEGSHHVSNEGTNLHGNHGNREEEVVHEPATETVSQPNEPVATNDEQTRKRKRGRPKGSKNKPKTSATKVPFYSQQLCPNTAPPLANNSAATTTTLSADASSSRPNSRSRPVVPLGTKTLSDNIAINMNCEFLGKSIPYKIARWAEPKQRARV